MALADSQKAIGGVTRLLHEHLVRRGYIVAVGKPEAAVSGETNSRLNLFLYEVSIDPHLRNVSLDDQQPAPLWFTLKYLLTAFDESDLSDSALAHELLGQGMSALHELNFLRLDASVPAEVRQALENNPEPLKITFDEASPELLSKVMQGSEERYRLSSAFQVRPVMIVPNETPSFSLLVGVDYSQDPAAVIGKEGIHIDVMASLGPTISRLQPPQFEPGQTITVYGEDLHLAELECLLGEQVLMVVGQQPDQLRVRIEGYAPIGVEGPIAAGRSLSAGEHPLLLRQRLKSGRYRSSTILVGGLRPVLTTAVLNGANLDITGLLLGSADDDILLALLQEGRVVKLFDAVTPGAQQKSLTVTGVASAGAGVYQVILRVNGLQARLSPTITVP